MRYGVKTNGQNGGIIKYVYVIKYWNVRYVELIGKVKCGNWIIFLSCKSLLKFVKIKGGKYENKTIYCMGYTTLCGIDGWNINE
jgi:hypothetical protein